MKESKYKTIEELLAGEQVLLEALKLIGIKPDYVSLKLGSQKPPYSTSQFTELLAKAQKEKLADIFKRQSGKDVEYRSGRTEVMSVDNPQYLIDILRTFSRSTQIEAFDLVLLMFTPEFREFVAKTRDLLIIKEGGFKSYEERVTHFSNLDKIFNALAKSSSKIKWISANFLIASISSFIEGTVFEGVEPGRSNLIRTMMFDYITMNNPFFSLSEEGMDFLQEDKKPSPHSAIRHPLTPKRFLNDSVDIVIAIYPTTTKEEAKMAIDDNWNSIEKFKSRLPTLPIRERLKSPTSMKLSVQVYDLYLQGKNYAQICAELGISDTRARKMVSEIKSRIKILQTNVTVS
jgi:hypothetical protein